MWSIGKINFESKVVLAPMAGITFLSYREFMKPFGVAYSITEMISDEGISHLNKKTIDYLKTSSIDRPVAIQLFGSKIDSIKKAIDFINANNINYDFLDLNLGCPVNKVYKNKAGSYWLNDLDKLSEYANEIVKYSIKPVTAKIRLGIDQEHINVFDTVKVLEKAGITAIAIHARTKAQLYSGKPQFDKVINIGKEVNIPIIISGDIFSLDDAINAMNITNATAVMVARGGIGNPFLIKQIDTYFKSNIRLENPTLIDQINYCRNLSKMIIKEKGEKTGISILRGVTPKFFNNFPNSKAYRIKLSTSIKTYNDLNNILKEINSIID